MPNLLKSTYLLVISLACLLLFSSCARLILKAFGMKMPKDLQEEQILHLADRYNIPAQDCYRLDTTYDAFLRSFDRVQFKKQVKNHHQPLQVLYYAPTGHLNAFQVNCYVAGFPNLDWERYGVFSTFPPESLAPIDSILPLRTHIDYLIPMSTNEQLIPEAYDHIVVVYWSRFLARQSKRLVAVVQKNLELAAGQKVRVLYVNMDTYFMYAGK